MASSFGFSHFTGRLIFALVLVFGTYNPTNYSYVSWVFSAGASFGPIMAIVGIVLLIAWIIYLRATFLSMGWLGIVLGGLFFAAIIWLLIDLGWLSLSADGSLTWVVLVLLSLILAVGMSWSHIRRRLTGQVDVDDLEDGRA